MARILIIEDEPDLVELYRLALVGAGHHVAGAFDHPELPLSRQHAQLDPDIIILDERLHGLSGIASMARLLRAFPRAKILFASADPDAIEISVQEGAHAALKKPFLMAELLETIQRLGR